MRLLRCPRCNTFNAPEAQKCVVCGFELTSRFCTKCGIKVEIDREKCPNCGTDLTKLVFTPYLIRDFADAKYQFQSKERIGILLREKNPNLTKIQLDSDIFKFFNASGNLYDALEVGKNNFVPILEKPSELRNIDEIWAENGDEGKIKFLKSILSRLSGYELYFPEREEEILFDEKSRPYFQVYEEKKKGFVDAKEFLCHIISHLKGSRDSLWEKEKNDILRKKCEIPLVLKWFNRIEKEMNLPSIKYVGISDKGPARSKNEDAILMLESFSETHTGEDVDAAKRYLFVLSDGLGGHEKGEVAAELILEGIKREFYRTLLPKRRIELEDVVESVGVVNNLVYSRNVQTDMQTQKMGGTVSGLIIDCDRFLIFNVGDSPIFLFTEDQTLELSTRDISQRKNKAITQAIGIRTSEDIQVHVDELQTPREKFRILICSDGLSDVISPDEMKTIIDSCKGDLHEANTKLIEESYRKNTTDNVSFILVQIERKTVIGSEI